MNYYKNYVVCTLSGEKWSRIPNYSRYECSNYGRIRTPSWKGGNICAIIKPAEDSNGYLRTMLVRDDGKHHTVKVHRIICQTFLENKDSKPTVNHIDCNTKNNCLDNLEWATHKEQSKHKGIMGNTPDFSGKNNPMYGRVGENAPSAKEVNMFNENGKYIKSFKTRVDAGKYLNKSPRTVTQSVQTKTKCGGYYFSDDKTFEVPLNKRTKRIYSIDLNGNKAIYNSIKDACNKLNIKRTKISACLLGRQKQSCGYKFKYV